MPWSFKHAFTAALLVHGLCLAMVAGTARAATYTTASHAIGSHLSLEVWLGAPGPNGQLLATIGPLAVTGSVEANLNLDGSGHGTIEFLGSSLVMESAIDQLLDLQGLGSMKGSVVEVGVNVTSQPLPVNANQFTLDNQALISIDQGQLLLYEPTGLLAALLGADREYRRDFAARPEPLDGRSGLQGTADIGSTLLDPSGEVNVNVDTYTFLVASPVEITARFVGEFHLAVPEPGAATLAASALPVLLGVMWLDRRRRRRCR